MCLLSKGLTSIKGSTSCNLCVPKFYSAQATPPNKTGDAAHLECISCPEGASCDVGTFTWSLSIMPGHYRFSQDSADVYTCKFAGNCIGTQPDGARNASLCLAGSGGPTCSVCNEGYYLDVEADRCEACDAIKSSGASTLFYVMAVVALFVVLVVGGGSIYNLQLIRRKLLEWKPTIRLWSGRMSQVVKTMQIIVLLNYNFVETSFGSPTTGGSREGYPEPYSRFVSLFEFMALDMSFLPFSCVVSRRFGHVEALLASTLIPLGVVGVGVTVIVLMRYRDKTFHVTGISQGLVAFIILIVPSVSRTICQSFRCIHYDRHQYAYLVADVSVDCSSRLYEAQLVYAIIATLIFPVGVPAVFVSMLWPLRKRLDPQVGNEAESIAIRANDETLTQSVVAQVFQKYRPRYWWYEIFDMYRRLSLTCFLLIFEKPASMIIFALGIAMLTTVMQREAQPYLDPWLASLSNLAHWQIVLCCVAILLVRSAIVDPVELVSIGALLLVANVFLMLAIFTDTEATLRRMAQVEALVADRAAHVQRAAMTGGSLRRSMNLSREKASVVLADVVAAFWDVENPNAAAKNQGHEKYQSTNPLRVDNTGPVVTEVHESAKADFNVAIAVDEDSGTDQDAAVSP